MSRLADNATEGRPRAPVGDRRETARRLPGRLRLPVVASPMFIVSTPKLVVELCKAGIVGSIPALNARPRELLADWIAEIKEVLAAHDRAAPDRPSAPFALNQIAHRTNDRLEHDMQVIADAQVPIVIVSLAAPENILAAVHSYGGLVINDVVNARHARRCIEAGVDGLIAVASGAGGHTGTISPFALVAEIREFWAGLLGLGGAISNGRGILAAEALGADFAYVGTSFIAAEEANASPGYKQMLVDAAAEDIVMSDKLTGVNANFMRQSLLANGIDLKAAGAAGEKGFGEGGSSYRAWRDVWSAGHGVGGIRSLRPAGTIVAQLAREYDEARRTLCQL